MHKKKNRLEPENKNAISGNNSKNKKQLKKIYCQYQNCNKFFYKPSRLNIHLRTHVNSL